MNDFQIDIEILLNHESFATHSGLCFANLRNYMVNNYNYKCFKELNISRTTIKDMIKFMLSDCYNTISDQDIKTKMCFVTDLVRAHNKLADKNNVITWECDW